MGKSTLIILSIAMGVSYYTNGQQASKTKSVKIGTQEWMLSNLDEGKFQNGDVIPEAKTAEEWKKAGDANKPVWSYYNNELANGGKYGKMYNWFAVNDPRGLAPKGWHIASDAEWTALGDFFGGQAVAGSSLKSNSGWLFNGNGNSSSGFDGLPGGFRGTDGAFTSTGTYVYWWTSSVTEANQPLNRFLSARKADLGRGNYTAKSSGLYVRCLKDATDPAAPTQDVQTPSNFTSIKLGKQEWTVTNLNESKFQNGDGIPEAKTDAEWSKANQEKTPAWCYYNNDPANGSKYGRLYNWYAVSDPRVLAPKGWRIPTDGEWTALTNFLGGADDAGRTMKSTSGWTEDGNGNNQSGLNCLPGGYRKSDAKFTSLGGGSAWWSSSGDDPHSPYYRFLGNGNGQVGRLSEYYPSVGYYVRCIKDSPKEALVIGSIEKEPGGFTSIKIGGQRWTATNLNENKFQNGDPIAEAKTPEEWLNARKDKKPIWCYYANDPANGTMYGKLYNWYAVVDPRGLAPKGWHIPTDLDWTTLTDYLGGTASGLIMKSASGWTRDGNGNNQSGLSCLPGGVRTGDGESKIVGEFGYWWSSSDDGNGQPWCRGLSAYDGNIKRDVTTKGFGYSLRCIKD